MGIQQKTSRFLAIAFTAVLLLAVLQGAVVYAVSASTGGGSDSFGGQPPTQTISKQLEDTIKKHQRYEWLRACFQQNDIDTIYPSEMESWDFFQKDNVGKMVRNQIVGNIYGPGDDAIVSCHTEDSVRDAFALIGFDSSKPLDVFCSLKGSFNKTASGKDGCLRNPDGSDWDNSEEDKTLVRKSFEALVNTKSPEVKSFSPAQEYLRYYESFMEQCITEPPVAYPAGDDPADNDSRNYKIPVVTRLSSGEHLVGYWLGYGKTDGTKVAIAATADTLTTASSTYKGDSQEAYGKVSTCGKAVTGARDNASAYKAYLDGHPEEGEIIDLASISKTTGSANSKSCYSESGPLGWFLCGILEAIDGAITHLDQAINDLLFINKDNYDNPNIEASWAIMRNIAFIVLIPMMLFMVIGTAIGFGPFDAYTVKKALPRMLVAVVFIAISLPLTQFGVQISNAVGNGAGNLIMSSSNNPVESLSSILSDRGTGGTFGGLVAAGAGASIVFTTIGIIGSFALVTMVALLIGFVILVMREVLILLLVVIAPLAILGWIFPGNDKLWKIWKTTLIAMLLMYPLIAVLIASGRFVAGIAE
jgi:hypothetical protein